MRGSVEHFQDNLGGWAWLVLSCTMGWDIIGVLNNDMIGNIAGIDGVIANTVFRVFSQATPLDL